MGGFSNAQVMGDGRDWRMRNVFGPSEHRYVQIRLEGELNPKTCDGLSTLGRDCSFHGSLLAPQQP